MGLRDRREARRGTTNHRYRMRQKLVSIGDDYWIEDASGERQFKVDGKAVRIRSTLILEDNQGNPLYKIQERKARIRDTMQVDDSAGNAAATVKKALVSPLRERWNVALTDGDDLTIKGNLVDHEYTIDGPAGTVASVSKKWFRVADTYGVEVIDGQNVALLLALTAVVDQMAHG
ncbi:MAG: hypothetical protein CMH41_08150 [Micrococcales bacterium]|nr:hypothetical protein [Micrococcales bacterium]